MRVSDCSLSAAGRGCTRRNMILQPAARKSRALPNTLRQQPSHVHNTTFTADGRATEPTLQNENHSARHDSAENRTAQADTAETPTAPAPPAITRAA